MGIWWVVHQLFIDFEKTYDSVRREVCKVFSKNLVYL
jgi:hypothetical protein